MNLLDIAYIRGSKAKEEKERERERARGSYIYIRCDNAWCDNACRSPYARGSAHGSESGGAIGATHVVVSQVAT